MHRNLLYCERDLLDAARFREREVCSRGRIGTLMNRYASAQVGKIKCLLAIATVRCADKLKKSFVLGDRQRRSVAEHPACRGEVAREDSDFTKIGLCHFILLFYV